MSALRIHVARKAYGKHASAPVAIEALRFELGQSEFVSVVGPSGCGKTTLLNIIAGLDQHFDGHVEFAAGPQHQPRLGYVFQEPRLLPWRTVRENLLLTLPRGAPPQRVDALLQAVGLTGNANQYTALLSLGMQRRVAIARAFAAEPDLLLLDEPLVSLDAPTSRRIRELLITMWQLRPCTVLLVTHDLREAIALSDRILFLTPPPTQLAADVAVDLPRTRRDDEAVDEYRQRILLPMPELQALI